MACLAQENHGHLKIQTRTACLVYYLLRFVTCLSTLSIDLRRLTCLFLVSSLCQSQYICRRTGTPPYPIALAELDSETTHII